MRGELTFGHKPEPLMTASQNLEAVKVVPDCSNNHVSFLEPLDHNHYNNEHN